MNTFLDLVGLTVAGKNDYSDTITIAKSTFAILFTMVGSCCNTIYNGRFW